MVSQLAWLDHSDRQRRQMMEIVGLFREKNTIDDLGIGSVRDTLSEVLFPGTSTLHTRARYLLFLPWICLDIERQRVPSSRGWEELKRREVRLIYSLLDGGEVFGVIGRDAKENLKNFPSFMYWSALERHDLRVTPMTRQQYLASLDGFYKSASRSTRDDEDRAIERSRRNWHAGIPEPDHDFLDQTTFQLTTAEADYLTERILASSKGSYLAHLVQAPVADDTPAPWAHPALGEAPSAAREMVDHAHMFSDVMHGAALLYNLMLAEAVEVARTQGGTLEADGDLVDHYRERLDEWVDRMAHRAIGVAAWDRPHFWKIISDNNPRVPSDTYAFVDRWVREVQERGPAGVIDSEDVRQLLRQRELQMKGKLARLRNDRSLERWQGAIGAEPLVYRWNQVAQIVEDIVSARETQAA